jgi:hypothetical protein
VDDESHVVAAAQLAARLNLPVVATHPVQFATADEYEAHEARVCIAEGEILANPRRVRKFTREQYFKSSAQMQSLFADVPSAIANTVEIAQRCNLTLVLGKPQLPDFPTPQAPPADPLSGATIGSIAGVVEPYYLGVFLLGAYQEILGDLHNLLGDTHAVHLSWDAEEGWDIDEVAVLYRNQGGWTPMADHYLGVPPPAPDLSGYVPGTNGLFFAPQGGLRASAHDLVRLLSVLDGGGALLSAAAAAGIAQEVWAFTGANGNDYYGLFRSWGSGVHRANTGATDAILPGAGSPTVMPLAGRDDAVAVHAVCQEAVFWETLERLKAAGASAILVLPIEKMM